MKEKQSCASKFHDWWIAFTIKEKFRVFAGAVVITIALAVCINIFVVNFSLYGFGTILDDNAKCFAFQEAVENEAKAFESFVRSRSDESRKRYDEACEDTAVKLSQLPFVYEETGPLRYAKTWSIHNAYEVYQKARNQVAAMVGNEKSYVTQLYEVYNMQSYLGIYARTLVQLTLQDGNHEYLSRVPVLSQLLLWVLGIGLVLAVLIFWLTIVMQKSIVNPIERLAALSRRIAQNDFSGEDIVIDNQDEMGDLVTAFNKMKRATMGYITALEEKHEITARLHTEELERVEMEKILEATRLEVLKSQINPHFLFNTLNMIACMAKLEEADTTERMITAMSNLFRYNLKTSETEIPLAQELKIVDDYLYIQQMRFGNRIRYKKELRVDENKVIIPSFSLQPIVENAIIHGISKKEQGGMIYIRVWDKGGVIVISVADTGLGVSAERLEELKAACRERRTSRIGIGLGNIYKRLHMMYEEADLKLYGKEGKGMIIQMEIRQEKTKLY